MTPEELKLALEAHARAGDILARQFLMMFGPWADERRQHEVAPSTARAVSSSPRRGVKPKT